jgi:hypothetical protein
MTRNRRVVLLAGLAMLALAVTLLVAFRPDRATDSQKVAATLDRCSRATEIESVTRIMQLLADDYSDDLGDSPTSLRAHLRQAFVGPTEWRVSWAVGELLPRDERTFDAQVAMRVQQVSEEHIALDRVADLRVTFVRQGRALKVQRVEGLRRLAEAMEEEYVGY